jgi:hypothetical protein
MTFSWISVSKVSFMTCIYSYEVLLWSFILTLARYYEIWGSGLFWQVNRKRKGKYSQKYMAF